jgi:hypothetical protein
MQLIGYQTDREDTAWNQVQKLAEFELTKQKEAFDQQLSILQYKADREDAAYQRSYQQQQLALARDKAYASSQSAKASGEIADAKIQATQWSNQYSTDMELYETYQKEWASSGSPSAVVQDFFGVDGSISFWDASGQNAISNKAVQIQNEGVYASQLINSVNDNEAQLKLAKSLETGVVDQQRLNFNETKYAVMVDINNLSDANTALTNIRYNRDELVKYMGETYYTELENAVRTMVNSYKYSM